MSAIDPTGLWRLVSYYDLDEDGNTSEGPLGPHPRGLLFYGADGYLSVNIMRPNAAPGQTAYLGYAGAWRQSGSDLVHRIEVCSDPTWADTDQVRRMSFYGDLLTLVGTATVDGRPQQRLLSWRRATDNQSAATPVGTEHAVAVAADLADLLTPYAFRTAASLGIADLIAGGENSATGLAAATGSDLVALSALLHHLATKGVFRQTSPDHVELTDIGRQLVSSNPHRESLTLDSACGYIARAWAGLPHALRTGGAGFPVVFGRPFWELINSVPGLAASFDRYMAAWADEWIDPVSAQLDLACTTTVVDVGGGNGVLLATLLDRDQKLHGTVVELESSANAARDLLTSRGLSDRATVVTGSFFNELPAGADVYLLAQILHSWSDQDAITILRRCATAAGAAGRVVVIERLVERDADHGQHAEMQLTMLNLFGFGVKERSLEQYVWLATEAGLSLGTVRSTDMLLHTLEFHRSG